MEERWERWAFESGGACSVQEQQQGWEFPVVEDQGQAKYSWNGLGFSLQVKEVNNISAFSGEVHRDF